MNARPLIAYLLGLPQTFKALARIQRRLTVLEQTSIYVTDLADYLDASIEMWEEVAANGLAPSAQRSALAHIAAYKAMRRDLVQPRLDP